MSSLNTEHPFAHRNHGRWESVALRAPVASAELHLVRRTFSLMAASFARSGKKVGSNVSPVLILKSNPGKDSCNRSQLRGPCQGAEECASKGAILLPQADNQLSPFWRYHRDSKGDHRSSRRCATDMVQVSLLMLVDLVELGLVIGKGGRDISEANAQEHIAGYGACTELCRPHQTQALGSVSSRH